MAVGFFPLFAVITLPFMPVIMPAIIADGYASLAVSILSGL